MTRTFPYGSLTRRALAWEARRKAVESRLHRHSLSGGRKWYLIIESKILTFLLARYGRDPELDWTPTPKVPPAFDIKARRRGGEIKRPKSGAEIRVLLARIADANEEGLREFRGRLRGRER